MGDAAQAQTRHRPSTGSLANLRPPWKPGQSGNPKGRIPERERFAAVVDRVLRERGEAPPDLKLVRRKRLRNEEIIARQMVRLAARGELEAIRVLADRLWPKPQKLDVDVSGGLAAVVAAIPLTADQQAAARAIAKAALLGAGAEPEGGS